MKDERGFILVGVLVCIVVLSLLVTPVILSLVSAAWQRDSAEKRLTALYLARGQLEELTAREYEDIGPMERESFPAPYGSFSFTVAVEEDPEYSRLKIITVTVFYPDLRTGAERSVTFTGHRAKR